MAQYKGKYECHVLTLGGFAGEAPVDYGDSFTDFYADEIRDYIIENKLQKPVIVGHSLGGFLALKIAYQNPKMVGDLVIVDSLPFLPAVQIPGSTEESIKPLADNMRRMMKAPRSEGYEAQNRAMLASMINSQEDIDVAFSWGTASDANTVADAMYDLYKEDLREEIASIESRVLVLGAWIAYKNYGVTRASCLASYQGQYSQIKNVEVDLTDKGKHFIMWDDFDFLISKMNSFLE